MIQNYSSTTRVDYYPTLPQHCLLPTSNTVSYLPQTSKALADQWSAILYIQRLLYRMSTTLHPQHSFVFPPLALLPSSFPSTQYLYSYYCYFVRYDKRIGNFLIWLLDINLNLKLFIRDFTCFCLLS